MISVRDSGSGAPMFIKPNHIICLSFNNLIIQINIYQHLPPNLNAMLAALGLLCFQWFDRGIHTYNHMILSNLLRSTGDVAAFGWTLNLSTALYQECRLHD